MVVQCSYKENQLVKISLLHKIFIFRCQTTNSMEQHLEENHICNVCHQIFEEKYELIKHIQDHINLTKRKVTIFT